MFSWIFKISLFLIFILKSCFCFSQQSTNDFVVVKEFKIIGNKTTKEPIIIREVPFSINDTILKNELSQVLERTNSNLFNTSLFNFITVEPVYFDDQNVSIYITCQRLHTICITQHTFILYIFIYYYYMLTYLYNNM